MHVFGLMEWPPGPERVAFPGLALLLAIPST